ncbi:MAG: DUF721 domain-containing protein [Betaproteobacteria bacterium]|nr:MAG: DUF721 domain-containing protein [Betaproteobacteria bacterium]
MRLPKIDRILSAEPELQPLLEKARDIRALARLVDGFLAPELSRQARVANFREGDLVLLAANSAAAAKLKLLAPSLSRFLLNQRWQVNSVSVRVQPKASRDANGAPQKNAHFSTATLDSLKELHEHMSDSPARAALRALLERCGAIPSGAPRRRTGPGPAPGRKPRT